MVHTKQQAQYYTSWNVLVMYIPIDKKKAFNRRITELHTMAQ